MPSDHPRHRKFIPNVIKPETLDRVVKMIHIQRYIRRKQSEIFRSHTIPSARNAALADVASDLTVVRGADNELASGVEPHADHT